MKLLELPIELIQRVYEKSDIGSRVKLNLVLKLARHETCSHINDGQLRLIHLSKPSSGTCIRHVSKAFHHFILANRDDPTVVAFCEDSRKLPMGRLMIDIMFDTILNSETYIDKSSCDAFDEFEFMQLVAAYATDAVYTKVKCHPTLATKLYYMNDDNFQFLKQLFIHENVALLSHINQQAQLNIIMFMFMDEMRCSHLNSDKMRDYLLTLDLPEQILRKMLRLAVRRFSVNAVVTIKHRLSNMTNATVDTNDTNDTNDTANAVKTYMELYDSPIHISRQFHRWLLDHRDDHNVQEFKNRYRGIVIDIIFGSISIETLYDPLIGPFGNIIMKNTIAAFSDLPTFLELRRHPSLAEFWEEEARNVLFFIYQIITHRNIALIEYIRGDAVLMEQLNINIDGYIVTHHMDKYLHSCYVTDVSWRTRILEMRILPNFALTNMMRIAATEMDVDAMNDIQAAIANNQMPVEFAM